MRKTLWLSLLVVLLLTSVSFGLIPIGTANAVCNGGNVSLDYTSFFNSSGNVLNFTVDVLSISGATINSVTCSGGAAIYVLSGSAFVVTFGAPIIGTDSTAYTGVLSTTSFPFNGLTNYQTIFTFTDNTSGVTFGPPGGNLLAVATNSTNVNGSFALSSGNITFDPPSTELFIYADPANVPSGVPEPGTLLLISTALGGTAVLRGKSSPKLPRR
jgi:hypothetical protein